MKKINRGGDSGKSVPMRLGFQQHGQIRFFEFWIRYVPPKIRTVITDKIFFLSISTYLRQ